MRRWVRVLLGAVVVLSLGGAATVTWLGLHGGLQGGDTCVAAERDLDGRCVRLDARPDVAHADLRPTGGRFEAPAQGLDVPLTSMSAAGGVLDPPSLTEAFEVRDPDRTRAEGTRPRIVAVHAVRGGRAPGNAFFEPAAHAPAVAVSPGDELRVDGDTYLVESTEVLSKADAAASPDVWGHRPGGEDRLVVLTCVQRAGSTGPARDNLVIQAVRA
ncbi:hypothetical protein ACQP60_12505 [Isoptericola variabilis]|uniref:hypothetical protein n=1 Tax=Isoptericola variabilis TaxID=139208 RepID=UPI003D1E252D